MWIAALFAITLAASPQRATSPELTPQKLFEAGKYQDAIDRIKALADAPKDQIYLRALAHRKLNQNDEAKEAFQSLAAGGDEGVWASIGAAGAAWIEGDLDAALTAAKKAIDQDGGAALAHFQLGLVESARGNQAPAAEAFAKAAELEPQFAYAHYEAGMAFYKIKRVDRMAVYFENFLKLAPNAPEAPAVKSIMKTVRGR